MFYINKILLIGVFHINLCNISFNNVKGVFMKNKHLGIPIYLDTKTLLDLLASMENGFSATETILTSSTDSASTKLSGKAGFGIKDVLSFFKMDLSASGEKTSEEGSNVISKGDRYHTYGSLMNRLSENLVEEDLIKTIEDEDSWKDLKESDFVELRGTFIPDTLSNSLKFLDNLLNVVPLIGNPNNINPLEEVQNNNENQWVPFPGLDSLDPNNPLAILNMFPPQVNSNPIENQTNEDLSFSSIKQLLKWLIDDLEREGVQTYCIECTDLPDHRAVTHLFKDYIRDNAGIELAYGEFKVIGKVVKKIEDGHIDLLKGTIVGSSEELQHQLLELPEEMGDLKMPDPITKIEAPALQIIPIAVYV